MPERSDALDVLIFSPQKAAGLVRKVLESAIANAENNEGADVDAEDDNSVPELVVDRLDVRHLGPARGTEACPEVHDHHAALLRRQAGGLVCQNEIEGRGGLGLDRLLEVRRKGPRVLVLAPTRELATQIALELKMSPQRVEDIRAAALLHDIGKLDISRTILYKAALVDAGLDQGFDSYFNIPRRLVRIDENVDKTLAWLDRFLGAI